MKKETIKKVLILGSGALKIGEAGEFDYSGSQALKAMKEEGIQTILINPNIATIQTSEGIANKVYFLPVTPYFVEKVIEKERPDGILLAFGGQTALNCGMELENLGILEKYNVKIYGTSIEAIRTTEDRDLFVKKLNTANLKTPKSRAVSSLEEAIKAGEEIGFPLIIRSAFVLGGMGSGFCNNKEELIKLAKYAFSYAPQILVEESLYGWKEIEFEVIRDNIDNSLIIANMENFDPLGIHTGESIVVAPTMTLEPEELKLLQDLAIKTIKAVGIVGECNIQFAFNSETDDYRVIEVNARMSRSSALASKATGYPLAFVAAKIAIGYNLIEIGEPNTPNSAALPPDLDYVIAKIPRWDLTKFVGVSREIGSSMKSVGEVMSIGKTFAEIMQKGLRMIGQGMHGFVGNNNLEVDDLDKALEHPTDQRIFFIDVAFQRGYSIDKIHELTKIDKWFLEKLQEIHLFAEELKKFNKIEDLSSQQILKAKQLGFSDFQIARFVDKEAGNMEEANHRVRNYRKKLNILPTVKRINTVAAEHPELTNYLYLTYDGTEHDIPFYKSDKSVIVLGSGAYRIGSSVEFDWCSVNAAQTARKLGYRTIMINYNPETVSTDYDICDKLYMDELSMERVLDIIELELPKGVILSMGGQIPNNLAMKLHRQHIPVLGTSPISIDRAENRHKFSLMLDQLGIDQPKWIEATTLTDVYNFCDQVGFPVLIRPSYVLSGAAMNVCTNKADLDHFLTLASKVSKEHPVVVSKFLENAKEIEFDAVAHNGDVIEYAISEHIEFAGVHSGDATLVFPPQKIYFETGRRIKKISKQIAKELNISGPFNIQFLAVNNDIKVIECNLRASRSFPFVSKILKRNFIDTATKIMLDAPYTKADKTEFDIDYIGVKSPMFSFSRLQQADPILGVDMSSTGEVGCIGNNFEQAIITSMLAVGYKIPKNIMLSTGETKSKVDMLEACRSAVKHGCNLFATRGTRNFLKEHNIPCKLVHWSDEKCENNVIDMINNHEFDLVVNIPKDRSLNELNSDFLIRRTAIDRNVPLITNARLAAAFIDAISEYNIDDITIKSWDEYKI